MNASAMNSDTFDNLLFAAANELDWPQLSAWTGYIPSTLEVPVDSIYLRYTKLHFFVNFLFWVFQSD